MWNLSSRTLPPKTRQTSAGSVDRKGPSDEVLAIRALIIRFTLSLWTSKECTHLSVRKKAKKVTITMNTRSHTVRMEVRPWLAVNANTPPTRTT